MYKGRVVPTVGDFLVARHPNNQKFPNYFIACLHKFKNDRWFVKNPHTNYNFCSAYNAYMHATLLLNTVADYQ